MGPVVIADMKRPFDQQRAKSGAVNEQVAFDPPVSVQPQRRDIAACAVQVDRDDASFDPGRAVAFGHGAQEFGIKAGVEMIGVVHPVVGQVRETPRHRRLQFQAIFVIGRVMALRRAMHPEMLEAR